MDIKGNGVLLHQSQQTGDALLLFGWQEQNACTGQSKSNWVGYKEREVKKNRQNKYLWRIAAKKIILYTRVS